MAFKFAVAKTMWINTVPKFYYSYSIMNQDSNAEQIKSMLKLDFPSGFLDTNKCKVNQR